MRNGSSQPPGGSPSPVPGARSSSQCPQSFAAGNRVPSPESARYGVADRGGCTTHAHGDSIARPALKPPLGTLEGRQLQWPALAWLQLWLQLAAFASVRPGSPMCEPARQPAYGTATNRPERDHDGLAVWGVRGSSPLSSTLVSGAFFVAP